MLIRHFAYQNCFKFGSSLKHVRLITDSDILKGIKSTRTRTMVRESRYDGNVKYLMPLLEKGNFLEVKRLVKEKKIDINSHDWYENTPLTDAGKRGDIKAIEFLVNEMGANVHASCDCPYHQTTLHYIVKNGHYEATKVILDLGADPNALDSRGYTALDLIKDITKNNNIKKLLIERGGLYGSYVKVTNGQKLNLPKVNCPTLNLR